MRATEKKDIRYLFIWQFSKVPSPGTRSNNVTVIDGVTNTAWTVAAGSLPNFAAVNPVTGKVYVSNNADVTVLTNPTASANDPAYDFDHPVAQ